ncbi:MAG: hypothetical protein R2911_20820 [Caldilineaceae bacterium]
MKTVQNYWRLLLTIWLIGLIFLLTPHPLYAQSAPPGLTMQARAAYDGYFKFGEWLPIWVELENNGPDLDAEIRVKLTSNAGPVTYAAPVALPTGSRKRLPIYVLPNNFSRELEVHLVDRAGSADSPLLLSAVKVEPLPNISYLVGVAAAERGAISFAANAQLSQLERRVVLADAPADELPERVEGLNSFDALIFNNVDAAALTPAQGDALQSWVGRGGRLIIGGGAAAPETLANLPAALQFVSVQGIADVAAVAPLADFAQSEAIAAPGPFTVAQVQVDAGETLASLNEAPLIAEARFGQGYVNFVALDLAGAPFNAWTGTTDFWSKLLNRDAEYANWLPPDVSLRQMRADRLAYPLSNLPSLDLPSIRSLSLLLLLYILLVGPVNYFSLRRLHKLHWAWVTIPLLTILFSAGAFGLGYSLRGNDLILNKIALIEPLPGSAANVTSFMGLFSPTQQSYEIEVDGSGLVSPMTQNVAPMGINGRGGAAELTIRQGAPARLSGLAVNQWSMQSFMTESYVADFGDLSGEFHLQGDRLTGQIRNQTGYALSDVVAVAGAQFKALGELAPGQEVSVEFSVGEPLLTNTGGGLAWQIYNPDPNLNPGADPNALNSRAMNLKRDILSGVEDTSFNPQWQNGGIQNSAWEQNVRLVAWLSEAPPTVRVAQRDPQQQTTALLLMTFPLALPDSGPFTLPPGMLTANIVERPFDGGDCGRNSVYSQNGQFVIEFTLPENLRNATIQKLQLGLRQDDINALPPHTEFFDWQSETWAPLENPVQGINELTQTERLISDDGRTQIRMTAQGSGGCTYVNLGYSGER